MGRSSKTHVIDETREPVRFAKLEKLSLDDARALTDKYTRMRKLRELHARAKADPSFIEPDPREEMRRLAAEFPGSLREIDRAPLDLIDARLHALSELIARGPHLHAPSPWMLAQALFHRLARGALAAKRWLGKRKVVTTSTRDELIRAGLSEEAQIFADELHLIACPPRGRLMDVVHAKVAATLEVSIDVARALAASHGELE